MEKIAETEMPSSTGDPASLVCRTVRGQCGRATKGFASGATNREACLEHDVIIFLLIIGERLEVKAFSHELVVDSWSSQRVPGAPLSDVA